jgi:hypothetical protein
MNEFGLSHGNIHDPSIDKISTYTNKWQTLPETPWNHRCSLGSSDTSRKE